MSQARRRDDEDFAREIEAHVALEIDRLVADGMSPDDARHAAARRFGNVTATKERFYESRRILWLEELRQDVRYAWRTLRRSPGFAAVAVLTLALGIGANTAIFSVVNAVLLRPLPYRDPGSLVLIQPGEVGLTPEWMIPAWRDRARTIEALSGFNGPRPATLIHRGQPEVVQSTTIAWDFLSFLGVAPALGRDFTAADAVPGAARVAMVSDDLWRRHFDADPGILGRSVTMSGAAFTVVGILPPSFRFPTAGALPAFGLPNDLQPDVLQVWDGNNFLNVIGRLRGDATAGAASQELLTIYRQASAHEFSSDLLERTQIAVVSLQDRLVGDLSRRLWLVMGAVTFVLLVACANVANLLLARASTRQRELAVRTALGARRGRLARLLLTESALLALIGTAGALVFAFVTRGVARTLLADRIPHVGDITLDWTVMAFTAGLAVVTSLLCGLVSLAGAARVKVATAFGDGATPQTTGRSVLRRALVSVETAVTFVLVVGAALFGRTLWALTTQDNGFEPDRILTVRVMPGLPKDIDRTDRRAPSRYWASFFGDLQGRLERIEGIESAGAVSMGPLEGIGSGVTRIAVDGRNMADDQTFIPVAFVTPGYFQTMRIPIVSGRDFTTADRLGADLVAIVNETFARRFAPGRSIVGARISTGSGPEGFIVIGVTRDVPDTSLRRSPDPMLIAPLAQMPAVHISWGALTFVLRTRDGGPMRLVPEVRRAIWAIDPNIVISGVATMNARVAAGMRAERDSALLFGLFAFAALVMAAIGVYGVASYTIAQRTREIGVRVALGAARHDVSRLIVSQTLWPTLIGVGIGLAVALLTTGLVASMVYGITPLDPATFATAVLALVSVALLATWVPTRRALRIDPLVALRSE